MEFNEKLKQLRKQHNLTQEQFAEQLYVSRTAISKWESGKGYPSIESLKCISKLLSVSIDELLSGEELIILAETENRSKIYTIYNLIYGILDLMALAFIFLPFYGQPDGERFQAVTLLAYHDISSFNRVLYFTVLILMMVLGIAELIIQFCKNVEIYHITKTGSVILHSVAILFFAAARQPYVTAFLFMLFMIKVALLLKGSKIK